jgi:N-acetylneuraminic acid mutarotase
MEMRIVLLVLFNISLYASAQSWQQLADYPGGARDDGAQFTINGIHYVGTGRAPDFSCKGDFHAFHPSSSSWTAIAPLPQWQERQYTSAFSYDGNGFIVGGENCLGNYFSTFLKYSPLTNSWTSMPDLPAAGRAGSQHFVIGSDLYLIGGRNNSGILNEVWCFHFNTNIWEQLNDLPFSGCWRGLAAAHNNLGYLFGGRTNDSNQTGWNTDTWQYDPQTDTWAATIAFQVGQMMYQSMAQQDSLLFVFGGVDQNDHTQVALVQIDLISFQIDTLTPFAASPRKGCIAYTSMGYFYLTTGISGNERLKETWRYAYLSNAGLAPKNPFDIGVNFKNNELLVTLQQPMNGENALVINLQGREMLSQKCTQETLSFDLTKLPTGTYFIQVGGSVQRFFWAN